MLLSVSTPIDGYAAQLYLGRSSIVPVHHCTFTWYRKSKMHRMPLNSD